MTGQTNNTKKHYEDGVYIGQQLLYRKNPDTENVELSSKGQKILQAVRSGLSFGENSVYADLRDPQNPRVVVEVPVELRAEQSVGTPRSSDVNGKLNGKMLQKELKNPDMESITPYDFHDYGSQQAVRSLEAMDRIAGEHYKVTYEPKHPEVRGANDPESRQVVAKMEIDVNTMSLEELNKNEPKQYTYRHHETNPLKRRAARSQANIEGFQR